MTWGCCCKRKITMIGMLWLDDGKASLEEKVRKAAAYYRRKHGQAPTWCFGHPDDVKEETAVDGITVKPSASALKHHLYMGVET